MEPISRVPVVKTRHSQPGSEADNMAAELLPFAVLVDVGVDVGVDDVAVAPVLVAPVLVVDVPLMVTIIDLVMTAPFPMVEVVEQEEDLGMG